MQTPLHYYITIYLNYVKSVRDSNGNEKRSLKKLVYITAQEFGNLEINHEVFHDCLRMSYNTILYYSLTVVYSVYVVIPAVRRELNSSVREV